MHQDTGSDSPITKTSKHLSNVKLKLFGTLLGMLALISGLVAGITLIAYPQLFEQKASTGIAYCGDGICNENAQGCSRDCGTNIINCGGVQCAAQDCHCQGGDACTSLKCEPDIRESCERQGRAWCSNMQSGGGMTCCVEGYVCYAGGQGCVPGGSNPPATSTPPSTSTSTPSATPSPTPRVTPSPTPSSTPTPTPSPTPTGTPTTSPTPTPVAMCQKIEIYSPRWTRISTDTFKTLNAGAKVYFCVGGFTNSSTPFDKARFRVNGTTRPETTTLRPGTGDFCDLYTIPQATYNFRVSGELHHPILGWH